MKSTNVPAAVLNITERPLAERVAVAAAVSQAIRNLDSKLSETARSPIGEGSELPNPAIPSHREWMEGWYPIFSALENAAEAADKLQMELVENVGDDLATLITPTRGAEAARAGADPQRLDAIANDIDQQQPRKPEAPTPSTVNLRERATRVAMLTYVAALVDKIDDAFVELLAGAPMGFEQSPRLAAIHKAWGDIEDLNEDLAHLRDDEAEDEATGQPDKCFFFRKPRGQVPIDTTTQGRVNPSEV